MDGKILRGRTFRNIRDTFVHNMRHAVIDAHVKCRIDDWIGHNVDVSQWERVVMNEEQREREEFNGEEDREPEGADSSPDHMETLPTEQSPNVSEQ